MNKTDNPLQGSFLVNELLDLVEEAILQEFERISDKGGVARCHGEYVSA